eukprot:UN17762
MVHINPNFKIPNLREGSIITIKYKYTLKIGKKKNQKHKSTKRKIWRLKPWIIINVVLRDIVLGVSGQETFLEHFHQ